MKPPAPGDPTVYCVRCGKPRRHRQGYSCWCPNAENFKTTTDEIAAKRIAFLIEHIQNLADFAKKGINAP